MAKAIAKSGSIVVTEKKVNKFYPEGCFHRQLPISVIAATLYLHNRDRGLKFACSECNNISECQVN